MSRAVELAGAVLGHVADRAEAEVCVTGGLSSLTRFANSFIHQNVADEGFEVSIRVAIDQKVNSASTTSLTNLREFVDNTVAVAELQRPDEAWPGVTAPVDVVDAGHHDQATARADPHERAERVRSFVDAAPGLRAAGFCETVGHEVAFANTAGHRAYGHYTRATMDGIHQTDVAAGSGHATSVRLADLDGGSIGRVAADRARRGADAFDLEPGEYPVVLGPESVATIAMFLAYYGFNGKAHCEGRSFAEVGSQQFDPSLSMYDDASDPAALGVGFDREGTPKRRLDLIRDGVTAGIAHDRRTAHRVGVASTGHAGPGSEVIGPIPTNGFVEPGPSSVADLIAAIDRGVYVATFNYCRVLDPKTLAVTGLTRNGTLLIENGRITRAVTNMRFTQSFVDALGPGRVLDIGDDARFANSEFGPGMMHVPSLRLAGWNFTGGAAG